MLYSGTDPESYITEYTLVYEEQSTQACMPLRGLGLRVTGLGLRIQGLRLRVEG